MTVSSDTPHILHLLQVEDLASVVPGVEFLILAGTLKPSWIGFLVYEWLVQVFEELAMESLLLHTLISIPFDIFSQCSTFSQKWSLQGRP